MYGIVNRAIEDLAIKTGGQDAWEAIKLKAGMNSSTFFSMKVYPDELTYKLIEAASQILNIPSFELLREFGKHWILFTSSAGYGHFLDSSGTNLKECIENLDTMHTLIASTMPNLKPPSFKCSSIDNKLQVHYYSDREGFSPMVIGLLEGLGEKFSVEIKVTYQNTKVEKGYETFEIEYI